MTQQDWQVVFTAVIAGSTVIYVVVTGLLVWVTRRSTQKLVEDGRASREAGRAERRRAVIRAAIAEGVENSRAWMAVQPRRLTLGEKQWLVPRPEFRSLTALIDSMDLPAEVVAYLLWARGYSPDLRDRYAACIAANGEGAHAVDNCRGLWDAALDLLQSTALLLKAHAASEADLAPVVAGFAPGHWLVAQPGPPRMRELEHLQRMAMDGAPVWPTGDAYAGCSPEARDREGERTARRQHDQLHGTLDAVGRVRLS